jgi:D-glycero-D-manno-heptose 1,7-bisphosphate phosphatase
VQAVILVGGLGTRLGDKVKEHPKPLLEVAGKPFLEHLFYMLARHGIRDIVLLAGYRADVVKGLYGGPSAAAERHRLRISVSVEDAPLGTAGALVRARDLLEDRFFLLNGDSIFDFNLLDLALAEPDSPEPLATLALRSVADARRYGIVETLGDRVVAFREKPANPAPGLINSGVYWLHKSVLDRVTRVPCSLEREVFPELIAAGRVAAKTYEGYFIDIGIPDDLARADREMRGVFTRPAVFFDRDDTLIHDRGYVHEPADLVWFDGVPAMIKRLNDSGVFAFIVTNQAGVAKGYFDEAAVVRFHTHFAAELGNVGAHVDDWRYCPHHEQGTVAGYTRACACRKPNPGMILDLLGAWPVDAERSLMLGNSDSDVAAGRAAGLRATRVAPGDVIAAVDAFLAGLEMSRFDG